MNDIDQNTRPNLTTTGVLLLPLGIYFFINGLGKSGWIWEGYTSWQPFSTIVIISIVIGLAIPLYRKFNISLSGSGESSNLRPISVILLVIAFIGIPVISVTTRSLSLPFDPLSIYIAIVAFIALYRMYGTDLSLLSLSLIPLSLAFLPMLNQEIIIGPNRLNENMLDAFAYDLSLGLFFISWGFISLMRHSPEMYSADQA